MYIYECIHTYIHTRILCVDTHIDTHIYSGAVKYDALKMCTELLQIIPLVNVNGLRFLNENDESSNADMFVGHTFYFCCVK